MSSTPPRFAVSRADMAGNEARIRGAELHHLRDVMRMRPGDRVGLIDDSSRCASGVIDRIEAGAAIIRIERMQTSAHTPPLILALSILKGPRMDFAIEKAAELGATAIWPIICARCVGREPGLERLARWRRLAAAAAKQSLAAPQVGIADPIRFIDFVSRAPAGVLPLICQAGGIPLTQALARATRGGILIACGPEGDFTRDEAALAQTAGFVRASLGPNRLRSETAAVAATAIAAAALRELS